MSDLEFTEADPVDACTICGQAEVILEGCATCEAWFCDDCGNWWYDPDDESNGDYFCVRCKPPMVKHGQRKGNDYGDA